MQRWRPSTSIAFEFTTSGTHTTLEAMINSVSSSMVAYGRYFALWPGLSHWPSASSHTGCSLNMELRSLLFYAFHFDNRKQATSLNDTEGWLHSEGHVLLTCKVITLLEKVTKVTFRHQKLGSCLFKARPRPRALLVKFLHFYNFLSIIIPKVHYIKMQKHQTKLPGKYIL